jgi:hypothetical protein
MEFQKKKKREILDWISPINSHAQQRSLQNKRQQGTGQWLLDCVEFRSWLSSKGDALLCYGIPGAGKTTLTSLVVDYLDQHSQHHTNIGLAYLYCDYQRRDEQECDELLASLLKQLSLVPNCIPSHVKNLYDRHEILQSRPSTDELENALVAIVAHCSRAFIVVDALDECSDTTRARLVSTLHSLQTRCGVNVLATSCSLETEVYFERCVPLAIRARDADVSQYLKANIGTWRNFVSQNQELQDKAQAAIIKAIDGMYVATLPCE